MSEPVNICAFKLNMADKYAILDTPTFGHWQNILVVYIAERTRSDFIGLPVLII